MAIDHSQDVLGQGGRLGLERRRERCLAGDLGQRLLDLLLDRGALSIELGQATTKFAEIGRRLEDPFGFVLLCHHHES